MKYRELLTDYFVSAIAKVGPRATLPAALPSDRPIGKTILLGYGKAAAEMALVACEVLKGEVKGCVVTRHGHGVDLSLTGVEMIEARHPVPDTHGVAAAKRMLDLAASAGPDDRVIFLASGGGSSLLCAPAEGISLAQKQSITDILVRSGLAIKDINLARRHLSRIKGGRLGAIAGARGAQLITYVISDVAGDDPALIASGPSIAAAFEPDAALDVLRQAGIEVSEALERAIHSNHAAQCPAHQIYTLATNADALEHIEVRARADGWTIIDAGRSLSGDASEWGRNHAGLALSYTETPGRHLMLSGGELTVKQAKSDGRGGPNLEYLTALLAELPPDAPIEALAGDTDGIDGTEENAGGYMAASMANWDLARAALATNRCYDLFESLGGLIITGPTRTNVNDIRMIAVEGPSG
jgi:hydroxypyruvate reductase